MFRQIKGEFNFVLHSMASKQAQTPPNSTVIMRDTHLPNVAITYGSIKPQIIS